MIASRVVVVVSEVVVELAFRMKLPRIHDVDASALYPSKSINEVDNFGRMYEYYNGEYGMFTNNCHMFANDLSRFLTYNTRPNYCAVFISVSTTCLTENINAFTSTYSHFNGNCNNYRRKQIRFRNNYCQNIDTPIFPAAPITTTVATVPTSSTTLSVMDLARSMAREREEMMRRRKK